MEGRRIYAGFIVGATQSAEAVASSSLVVTPEHPGRALASNCFQCHGTNGYGYEELAGSDASGIIHDMIEMTADNVGDNIMNVHARAYTQAEIALIADFFSRQPSNH